MPQISPNTSNISTFGFSATFDIYNRALNLNFAPFTTGAGLGNTKIAISVIDQDGVTLASINWTTPQIPNPGATLAYTLDLSPYNFAFLFQTYTIIAAIQDQNGTVYQTNPIYPNLCQPANLTDSGYVSGTFEVIPDCVNSVLTVKERTLMVYNGLQPQSVSKSGVLNYPTGTVAAINFSTTPFINNVIYSGTYGLTCTTAATYALGGDVYVIVTYLSNNYQFPISCKNKMANILCCIVKVQQVAVKNCDNAIGANAKKQLSDISMFVMNGLLKEISGHDAQFEVDYIKKYLGCDCGSESLSQSEFTPINPAVNSIVLQGQGGTTVGSPTVTGNTITYKIGSNVYQVTKGNTGDLAFTIQTDTSVPNTVKYVITFNYDAMAGSILTAIAADPSLINQLNTLIQAGGAGLQGLDGSCVIELDEVSYSLSQAVTNLTLISNIVINGVTYAAPSNLFANNAAPINTWLNSLTLGVFNATVNSGILTILSIDNANTVSTMTFSGPNVTQQFAATNATLVEVLQAIINYLCQMTDLQIALKNSLTLCMVDYNGNVVSTGYPATTTSQASLNAAVASSICNLANRMSLVSALTCAKLQSIFSDAPLASFNLSSDRILSIIGGSCVTATGYQLAFLLINAINTYNDVKNAFCAIDCALPGTCPSITAINMSIVGSNIGIYGVSFSQLPLSNQTVTVQYRITGTTTYLTATNALSLFPNGNINGTSPYQISGLLTGTTYDVLIPNNCGGAAFLGRVTTPSGTSISGNYRIDNTIYLLCGDVPVTLYSSLPFATGTTMFTNSGLTTPLTGFTLIANAAGVIYTINTSTGVVGSPTGNNCTAGTGGTYLLGNNTGTICSGSPQTLYTNGSFTVGGTLYLDASLTTPVTGFAFVAQVATQVIYNLNSSTGVIASTTGLSCSGTTVNITTDLIGTQISNVGGIAGFTPSPSFPLGIGGTITGNHGAFTGSISVTFTGSPSIAGNVSLEVNGVVVQCINVPSAGTYTFSSRAYAGSDSIQLAGNTGSC